MSGNRYLTRGGVASALEEVRRRIETLGMDPAIASDLSAAAERVAELESSFYPTRLAGLATRIASHFFVEKSMPLFCERVLDEIIEEVNAGSGAVILFKSEAAEAKVIAARDAQRRSLSQEKLRVSRTILSRIAEGEDSVLVQDAISDELLGREESIRVLNLRSVLAIPLRFQDYLAGAIHLENKHSPGAFTEEERRLLLETGRLIAIYLNAAFRLDEEIAARRRIYDELKGKTHFDGIVGSSPRLLEVLETVAQVGPSEATVIIEGENGTGKELVARAIHRCSKRAERPMVVVNCAAIPENLLESELFGHEKGAFTGAFEKKVGRFEEANGGTLFLDEIGEMSLALQAKLLRFLQSRELQRVGGNRTFQIDARLVAATNRDIRAMVKEGTFREDLYFRIYVVPIRVPALREHPEDIPLLVEHFIQIYALQMGRKPPEIAPEVFEAFQQYSWPGNIRELENLIQRLMVLCRRDRIDLQDLPEQLHPSGKTTLETQRNPFRRFLLTMPSNYEELKRRRNEMHRLASVYAQKLEDRFIDAILQKAGGNISRAAEEAGIHRTLIHRNLRTRGPSEDPETGH